jgi:hypothetical protein
VVVIDDVWAMVGSETAALLPSTGSLSCFPQAHRPLEKHQRHLSAAARRVFISWGTHCTSVGLADVPIQTIDCPRERIEEVGLQTVEAKSILGGLQQVVVRHQLAAYLDGKRSCPHCQRSRAIKGYHPLRFRSAYCRLETVSIGGVQKHGLVYSRRKGPDWRPRTPISPWQPSCLGQSPHRFKRFRSTLKNIIDQRLRLRGSRAFAPREAYERFLDGLRADT